MTAEPRIFNSSLPFPLNQLEELRGLLDPVPSRRCTTTEIRAIWLERLATSGWVPNFIIPNSRMSISYWKDGFGVCVQLGNTCRVNSDMLKLETLFRLSKIRAAALVVPSNLYSKFLGSNHASVSFTERDLAVFETAITVPIAIIGVEPPES
jgi:hypothetical protein